MTFRLALPALLALVLLTTGCSSVSYTTPGKPADLKVFGVTPAAEREKLTDYQIRQELDRKPLATFPANLCLVRVQDPQYKNYRHHQGYGRGAYAVVLTRDIETDEHMDTIRDLPMVAGLTTVNRMIVPRELETDMQLRQAAAKMHAQILLLYTLDTEFVDINKASPVDVVTFGFGEHKQIRITTTASAVLMDVRNGYIYGLAESTATHEQPTNSWNNEERVDESRRKTEAEAFDQLVGQVGQTWKGVVATYAVPAGG